MANPVADITDLYVFPSPENDGHLVIILNTYPLVNAKGHFSDQLAYMVTLQPVEISGEGNLKRFIAGSQEYRFDCRFKTPHTNQPHSMHCLLPNGENIHVEVDDLRPNQSHGVRAFAGKRSDSFLFSSTWFETLAYDACLPPGDAKNDTQNLNVLSIALEFEIDAILAPEHQSLIGVYGETAQINGDSGALKPIDRVGRPEIVNGHLIPLKGAQSLKDDYNQEVTLSLREKFTAAYTDVLMQNLEFYDGIDEITDWTPLQHQQLITIILDDYLVVDLSKPFSSEGFLDLERTLFESETNTRAGGRVPGERIVNDWINFTVNAGHGRKIADGIAPEPLEQPFPYLKKPSRGVVTWLKTKLAGQFLKPTIRRQRDPNLVGQGDCH